MNSTNQNLQNQEASPIWDSESISAALGQSVAPGIKVYGVSIDSRTISAGNMFVAIKGEHHNGNKFALDALKKGASICVIDEKIPGLDDYAGKVLVVSDALEALRQLATFSRNRTQAKIIAVTGSVGKTSTKEMLKAALDNQGEVYASVGNFNNHFGLPLSLANMPKDIEYGIFELGMNHAGEILELTKIVRPDIAIVTTIEAVHLEFFSSISAIAEAKAEIFAGVQEGGYAIINYDNPYHLILVEKAKAHDLKVVSFGTSSKLDYILENYQHDANGSHIAIDARSNIIRYSISIPGKHHALNSLAVLAAVDCAGADVEFAAQKGLANFKPQKRRGQIRHNSKLGITIIDDTYNASPASVTAALNNLGNMEGRKLAVLGDMRELGAHGKELHIDLRDSIASNNIDKVFCVGELMGHLFSALPNNLKGCITNDSASMAKEILNYIKHGDIILVKGSRSMEMEKVVDEIAGD